MYHFSRLQEFQFKFLHNILVNNKSLYKWKLTGSDPCRSCRSEPETNDHMIWECSQVKPFWCKFVKFIFDILHQQVTKQDVYLGVENVIFTAILLSKEICV